MELLTLKEAADFATNQINKNVSTANITYLLNYGKIEKIEQDNSIFIDKQELLRYYKSYYQYREKDWKKKLGNDLNWALSFDNLKEVDTTKHVHRLHPYKGKFIPQLVEYFLDTHIDDFKKEIYFEKGDIVLDPFCGSGTTLIQANELEINAIGIDVSTFNALITNVKITPCDLSILQHTIDNITQLLNEFVKNTNTIHFEQELLSLLSIFNNQYFPVPNFKYQVQRKMIDAQQYGNEKAKIFLPTYEKLIKKYNIRLLQPSANNFLEKWFMQHIRQEIEFVFNEITQIQNHQIKEILTLILSRTMRSCRATTHADLATLKEPIITTYFCAKHGKICKPLFSILKWWKAYSVDTISRLKAFDILRTQTHQICLVGDSRKIDILELLQHKNKELARKVKQQKIKGIFSSPPYVGLIDYHEQHAYAYDLFGFERKDEQEIGPLYKGQGKIAQQSYVEGIVSVLNNCKQYLADDYSIFLVSNDKYNLYPQIAEKTKMEIVNQFKRPVLNRTEKDKGAYAEIIFHLKKK